MIEVVEEQIHTRREEVVAVEMAAGNSQILNLYDVYDHNSSTKMLAQGPSGKRRKGKFSMY